MRFSSRERLLPPQPLRLWPGRSGRSLPVNYQWIVTTLTPDQLYLYIAASSHDSGSGPAHGWYRYYEKACGQSGTPTLLGDEPHLGITHGRAFVDVRYCNSAGQPPNRDTIWEFNLPAMEQGQNDRPRIYPVQNPTVMNMRPVQNGSYGENQWFAGEYTDSAGAHVVPESVDTNSSSTALNCILPVLGVKILGPSQQACCLVRNRRLDARVMFQVATLTQDFLSFIQGCR